MNAASIDAKLEGFACFRRAQRAHAGNAAQSVDVQQKVLAAGQERSNIAEAQYGVGFISYDNWSIIEDNLVQYKKAYLTAQANALLAEAQWIQAKGETLEYAK